MGDPMDLVEEPYQRTQGPVHEWFELSYSSYLVAPRVLMQSMPLEWQRRMVACLEQLNEQFSHVERAPSYRVEAGEWHYPDDLSAAQMTALGVTREDADEDGVEHDRPLYHDAIGNELENGTACVFVPGREPLPGYRHGYVQPRPLPGPTDSEEQS